jgi:hypothetical protein
MPSCTGNKNVVCGDGTLSKSLIPALPWMAPSRVPLFHWRMAYVGQSVGAHW